MESGIGVIYKVYLVGGVLVPVSRHSEVSLPILNRFLTKPYSSTNATMFE
jgi:hypothetical protein